MTCGPASARGSRRGRSWITVSGPVRLVLTVPDGPLDQHGTAFPRSDGSPSTHKVHLTPACRIGNPQLTTTSKSPTPPLPIRAE